jgi:hypothetical protein
MADHTARCLCGAVGLRLGGPLLFLSHCHCASCRRAHAAAFVSWTAVPNERFEVVAGAEELRAYRSSEHATRTFCGVCGTSLSYVSTDWPGKTYVPAALIEGPLGVAPDGHVNTAERVPWLDIADGLPQHRGLD